MAVISQAQGLVGARTPKREGASFWVATREALWIALDTLRTHKLRSFLTLLGVVIATTTLIVVMSVVNGMNEYIADHIANLGTNTFIVSQFQWAQGYENWLKARRRNKRMGMDDYDFLEENLPDYKSIGAAAMSSFDVRYQSQITYDVEVGGVTPSMIGMGEQKVDHGRYLNETDYAHNSMVCFIGQDLVDKFFPSVDPLGKEILVRGLPFRVIGTAERIGTTFGISQDNFVQIPLTTFVKLFQARPNLDISVQAWDAQQMSQLEDQVRALMRARRHTPYRDVDPFGINASETLMAAWHQLTGTIFAVTIGVVAVFMVVGGIVIMNIMLASVTERTHEIGIRKSLGARRRDILMQFVMESAVMAAAGGLLGIALAILVSRLVALFFTAAVPLTGVVAGVVLATGVGLFFGIYPASQAARLDPIEALRTEN